MTITLQALSLVEKVEPVQLRRFTLRLREYVTEYVSECTMDVKCTWIPTWHRMDHVSWSFGFFFKTRFLEVGLTQKPGDHGTPKADDR